MKKLDFKGPRDVGKPKCANCGQETHRTFVPESDDVEYSKACFREQKEAKKESPKESE
ncbi:hypothetical protein [Methanococcoides sp. FTZ1]|uniref:hypothetical protein n=1 Tax=Methanococcoides sp. FTZ1 TaxID=3439061 RepID=UPI003F868473